MQLSIHPLTHRDRAEHRAESDIFNTDCETPEKITLNEVSVRVKPLNMEHAANNEKGDVNEQAMDLRMKVHSAPTMESVYISSGASTSRNSNTKERTKRRGIGFSAWKKHKKYWYLLNRSNRNKNRSDSGNFGSSSVIGSSSATGSVDKNSSGRYNSSPSTSTSQSSGDSNSPQTVIHTDIQSTNEQNMCMIMGPAIPLIVMMQGQLQSTTKCSSDVLSYSNTMLFKCNMCNMFSNNLMDVLNHVNNSHANVHYCFACNLFHSSKSEYDRHKDVCSTGRQAFQQIIDGHYQGSQSSNKSDVTTQAQPLNLTVAESIAMRAAQIVHSKKGKARQRKIKKLLKCTYCKKAFFGRFYLQRHLRSHTGEKLCHCNICGKGFAEWRNLRNHISRFHNSSGSISSETQSKSCSPNITSDSDQLNAASAMPRCKTSPQQQSPKLTFQEFIEQRDSGSTRPASPSIQTAPATSSIPNTESSLPNTDWSSTATPSNTYPMTSTNCKPAYSSSNSQDASNSGYNHQSVTADPNDDVAALTQSTQADAQRVVDPEFSSDKPVASYLGTTSSRLEFSSGQAGHEQSLNPLCHENGEKFYLCNLCSKEFRTKFAMQRHLDFHADKRPYDCDQCDYKAKTRPQLKVHVMRHSGEKGFNCSICNYSCVTHSDLNRHCKSKSHLFRASLTKPKQSIIEASANRELSSASRPVDASQGPHSTVHRAST